MNLFFVIAFAYLLWIGLVKDFKIAYYEEKLKNRGVDISHIENIGLIDIFKK